ncbi:MAG: arylsulfatase [Promethearchaeota archaeon]
MSNLQKPHIILIMTDQHRGDALGCAGNPVIHTPNLDALATDGVLFQSAYTSVPSCTPARAGLLTGMAPWNHGMLGYARVARKYSREMPRMLRDAGYYTFGIGKMHWYPQRELHGFHGTLLDESGRVESPGFESDYRRWFREQAPGKDPDATGIGWNENTWGDYALEEYLHPTAWTGDQATRLIKEYGGSKPLYLKISFARPHSPYDAPARLSGMYNWEDMPEPFIGDWCSWHGCYKHQSNPFFGDYGLEHAKKARRHYYANVTFIDEQVGRIVDALKAKGMYEESLVLFTADHGDMLGDHHHWRKTYAYEGSARIPMIMKWPSAMHADVSRGATINHTVELRDVLPTFLDACGQTIPGDIDGASMLELIRSKECTSWREYIDMEHSTCYHRRNYWLALTDGKMKYIFFRSTGREQLFDLVKDPGEEHDCAGDETYVKQLEIWRARMVQHLEQRGRKWVKNGKLRKHGKGVLHSPNFPGI